MGYIDKAPQAIRDFARTNKDFLRNYENDSDFRRFSDLIVKATKEDICKCIEFFENQEARCKNGYKRI